jgi:ubiquinone/menaquinone biosynthesis C-methylase UbiE
MQQYWDAIYAASQVHQLGWYEPIPAPSLRLVAKCALDHDAPIIDIGAGASTLLDCLLEQGYRNLLALDISAAALDKLRARLGDAKAARVKFISGDITQAHCLDEKVALWHDRAMLHFLTQERQRRAYLSTLQRVLCPGGYVILAAFAVGGATRCSGLDVRNYDRASLTEFLGSEFRLIESFDYLYHMPSGDTRPYIYTLFQRNAP